MKRFRLASLLVVAFALSACAGSTVNGHRRNGPPRTVRAASASGLMHDGTVRCTATVPASVEAGHELDIVFRFHNISKRTAKVDLAYGGMWFVARSPDGTTYDTRIPFENELGPVVPPTPIAPGATKTVPLRYVRVRWEGPLRITPGCGLTTLRPVRVAVTSPGPPVSGSAAVKAVVAASGHLLDRCPPRVPGVSVVGRLDPPSGNAPPMRARCSVALRRESGFDVAQVLIVTPPDMRGVHVDQTYEALTGIGAVGSNAEAIAWQFVVTRRGATSVGSSEADTTRSGGGMAPEWDWTGSKWEGPGGTRCGGSGGGGGGVDGPLIAFISVCGR